MRKFFFFFFLFLIPFFAISDTYQDAAGTSQMIADSFNDLWTYFFDDVPNLLQKFFAWLIVWLVKAKIYIQLETIKFSWGVAKVIISDLQIMSQITAQINLLPQDVRQILVDMRLFDGVNLLLTAYVTRFVMDFTR